MSTVISKNVQIGADGTPSNNFTWYQPSTPDGTVRLGSGNSGSVTDILSVSSSGLTLSGLTLSSGTANGVAYLNGSKVLTSGSALTFDGTTFKNTSGGGQFYGTVQAGVAGATNGRLRAYTAASDKFIEIFADGTTSIINSTMNSGVGGPLAFLISDTEQMRLTSTGLGIGTSSPGAKLDIVGATSNQIRVGTATSEHYRIGRNSSDGLLDFYGSQTGYQGYRFGGIDGTWATINSSGNLGLGVTPSAWHSTYVKALQIGDKGSALSGFTSSLTSIHYTNLSTNAYYDAGGWKYIATDPASLYQQANQEHRWYNAPSGTAGNAISFTQAMTLDTSGRLILGGTNYSSTYSAASLQVTAGTTNAAGIVLMGRSSDNVGDIYITNNAGTTAYGGIEGSSSGLALSGIGATSVIFGTNGSERARIDSSGNLLINATSGDNNAKLQLGGTSTTMRFVPTVDNTGYIGQSTHRWAAIYAANGTIQTSDGREKNTIENSVLGLDFVKALRPVSFKWNVGENVVTYDEEGNQVVTPRPGTRTHFGFIAQEVKEALGTQDFGGYVEEQDGRLGLRYDQFISPLVKAIQEQQAIIEQLKARLDAANL